MTYLYIATIGIIALCAGIIYTKSKSPASPVIYIGRFVNCGFYTNNGNVVFKYYPSEDVQTVEQMFGNSNDRYDRQFLEKVNFLNAIPNRTALGEFDAYFLRETRNDGIIFQTHIKMQIDGHEETIARTMGEYQNYMQMVENEDEAMRPRFVNFFDTWFEDGYRYIIHKEPKSNGFKLCVIWVENGKFLSYIASWLLRNQELDQTN